MRVRFWGTRGSLPVSLTAADIKDKIVSALLAAAGRNLKTREDAEAFVDHELPFALANRFFSSSWLTAAGASALRPSSMRTAV